MYFRHRPDTYYLSATRDIYTRPVFFARGAQYNPDRDILRITVDWRQIANSSRIINVCRRIRIYFNRIIFFTFSRLAHFFSSTCTRGRNNRAGFSNRPQRCVPSRIGWNLTDDCTKKGRAIWRWGRRRRGRTPRIVIPEAVLFVSNFPSCRTARRADVCVCCHPNAARAGLFRSRRAIVIAVIVIVMPSRIMDNAKVVRACRYNASPTQLADSS